MNWWRHLGTFLWLRRRIRANRMKRAAAGSRIIEWILSALSALAAVVTFLMGAAVGAWVLSITAAPVVMLVWDGVTAIFLFFWLIELINELQRSEVLSLQNFMHLPVTLSGVF